MRRDLTIRCVSRGTIRTEGPVRTRCNVREIWLELDGAPTRVQIVESHDRGQHTRDCTIELEGMSVRIRTRHDVKPPTSVSHAPFDWLLRIAEWIRKGERRTVSLWVRSMDPAALLNATPATINSSRRSDQMTDKEEGTAPVLLAPSPRLRFIAARS